MSTVKIFNNTCQAVLKLSKKNRWRKTYFIRIF